MSERTKSPGGWIKNHRGLVWAAILVGAVLLAARAEFAPLFRRKPPTPTPLPMVSLLPEPYTGTVVRSVCLEVTQHYDPALKRSGTGDRTTLPIQETLTTILLGLGVKIVEPSDDCDASISVSAEGRLTGGTVCEGLSDNPCLNPRFCYTDGSLDVAKELRISGETVHSDRFQESKGRSGPSGCAEDPTLDRFWEIGWERDLVDWLAELWGPRVYVRALGEGMVDEAALESVEADKTLIAELFLVYDRERTSDHTKNNVLDALGVVTGQSFGRSISAWRAWWNEQP